MTKYLRGVVEEAGASGVVPLNYLRPRPERRTVTDVVQGDGPYEYVAIEGFKRMSAQVTVDGCEAKLSLEVTNGDPGDEDTPWHALDDSGTLDGSGDAASDMLHGTDLAYRYARVSWNSGSADPTITVEFVANC